MKNILLASLVSAFLVACGGGGGGTTATSSPAPDPTPTPLTTLFATSYENMKSRNLSQFKIPAGLNISSAWAVGDFFGDGTISIMLSDNSNSISCYSPAGIDPACISGASAPLYINDSRRAVFRFYKLTSSNTLEATNRTVQGCLTPRKAVVADFNRDGHADIFVACHGWDAEINGQWPGEPSKLLINDGHGNFTASDVGATDRNASGAGYYHGASAADINGDGYPDIVLTDNFRAAGKNITVLINQQTNPVTFAVDDNRVGGQTDGPYFSVEFIDLNGDGKVDIVAGGGEAPNGNAETVILYNDGNGYFGFGTRKTTIPAVINQSNMQAMTPMDFTVFSKAPDEKLLMISRTDYSIQSVQIYNIKTNTSTIVRQTDNTWVEWWLPATKNGVKGMIPYSDTRNKDAWVPMP